MTVLYLVLPLALVVASAAVGAFIWTVHSGQLDDVDTPSRRMLCDDGQVWPTRGDRPTVETNEPETTVVTEPS
jgi:cbb3-type cytochrome oxidase maturation protein